MYLHNI